MCACTIYLYDELLPQGHLLSHHPSHGSRVMFDEAPLHTALRALVLEHLLLPVKEAVQRAGASGQDQQQLPWLTKVALEKPIKNCNAVFKVSSRRTRKFLSRTHLVIRSVLPS